MVFEIRRAPVDMVVYPTMYQVLYIPGGCLGFLNHQKNHPKKCETTLVFLNAGNPNDEMLGPWTSLTTCLKAEEAPFRKQTNKYTRQLVKHHSNLLIQQLIIFLLNVFVTLLLHLEEIFNFLKQNNWSQESVVSHKTPTTGHGSTTKREAWSSLSTVRWFSSSTPSWLLFPVWGDG